MHEDDFFLRPYPPPRPTSHLWFGVFLSGCILGLGTFYVNELRGPPRAQLVLDIRPPLPMTASNAQVTALLTDVKQLMAELRATQHALAEAQTRIAALEQENQALRHANATASIAEPAASPAPTASLAEPAPLSTPSAPPLAVPPAATPTPEGIGGPLIRDPEPPAKAEPIAGQSSGPRACWMRDGTMVSTYRITVRDDGFVLAPAWQDNGAGAWPSEFGAAMAAFRGKPQLGRVVVSREDFKKIMRPYYNFGMKQDAQCRFLVAVSDETSSRASWDNGLKLVERYFFKKVRGGGADEVAFRSEQ